MELRDFAEAVLFSADLSTKLSAPEVFTDRLPGGVLTGVQVPGRPQAMPLVAARAIPAAPTPHSIQDERIRGGALHTFANHELQALELMALALLRFPEAPAGFRMGLAHIIRDEQRHFRLYQERAEHWGVELGDVGVGHFFWNTVADLRDVGSFLAALSLTYEQANLDFAAYWKPAFAAVDDPVSAAVLQVVADDEEAHVAHGVRWFERLMGGADFELYKRTLAAPLTPGRAKGPVFNREARLRAGLSPAFVDEVEIHPLTRGGAARVFSFHPFVEEQVAGRTVPKRVRAIETDLGALPMFFAGRDDVVLGPRPDRDHLLRLHRAGFAVPEFVASREALGSRAIRAEHPWGRSPEVCARVGERWDRSHAVFYDKRWAFALRRSFAEPFADALLAPPAGAVVSTVDEAVALVRDGGDWIAKAPFSSSGQHRIRLRGEPEARSLAWLTRTLAQGSIVVEPWYDRLADVSAQIEVGEAGVEHVGMTRFWTAGNGAYRGAQIGPWTQGLPKPLARAVHGGVRGGAVSTVLREAARWVGEALHDGGYRGPAGIDAMVVSIDGEVRVVPILEVNPRYTMGRVALALRQRCSGVGGWLFVTPKQLRAAGYSTLEAFRDATLALPIEVRPSGMRSGVVCTNDPVAAEQIVSVLCVGPTVSHAAASWQSLGLEWPESA
ncbi:MAG: DUF455 family protein [Proteobacteria bacterium]|nr:DUF455 family protein [Pseudomonadota bacterium]